MPFHSRDRMHLIAEKVGTERMPTQLELLRARVEQLEAENRRLRAANEGADKLLSYLGLGMRQWQRVVNDLRKAGEGEP